MYGAPVPGMRRQALHAARLEFTHPRLGERLQFTAPPPEDFARLLNSLRGDGDEGGDRSGRVVPRAPRLHGRARGTEREV